MSQQWEYLGDGVYVTFDGFHIVLATGSHVNPDNIVHLDPDVMVAFTRFVKRLHAAIQDSLKEKEE